MGQYAHLLVCLYVYAGVGVLVSSLYLRMPQANWNRRYADPTIGASRDECEQPLYYPITTSITPFHAQTIM